MEELIHTAGGCLGPVQTTTGVLLIYFTRLIIYYNFIIEFIIFSYFIDINKTEKPFSGGDLGIFPSLHVGQLRSCSPRRMEFY